jgi:tetratricopeptide (TPR) repeat protein
MKNFLLLFIITFLIYVLPVTAQLKANPDDLFRLAITYEQAGQFEKAESIYRELLSLQPSNYIYTEALNKNLMSQKKYNGSILLLENKKNEIPNNINLYGLLGTTYYMMGNAQKAYDIWEEGISNNSSSILGYRIIANYAIENRAFDKAIEYLKKGNELSADKTSFSLDLANIYIAIMKFKDAANEFCRLITSHPEELQIVISRMVSYLTKPDATAQTIEVVKDFKESKQQVEFFELLSYIYQTIDKYDDAFQTVIESNNKFKRDGTSIFVFGQEAYRNRKYNQASKAYKYLIGNFPQSPFYPNAKIGYARSLEAALDQKVDEQSENWKPTTKTVPVFIADYKKLIKAYDEFVKGYPDNSIDVECLFRMAEIFRNRIIDYKKADSLYDKLLQITPNSNYGMLSFNARGVIAIMNNDLESAYKFFLKAKGNPNPDPDILSETKLFLAKIEFWKGNFSASQNLLIDAETNLSADHANDAIELSSLISATKKDSVNLARYAHADLLSLQNKHKEAVIEFKTLSDNPNLFILNDFAKIKFAEMLIVDDDFSFAVKLLEDLSESQKTEILVDKSTYLLGLCYKYGIKDFSKAVQTFQKLLEKFPNSLYFDHCREQLQGLNSKIGS